MSENGPQSICLLLNELKIPEWFARALELLEEETTATVDAIVHAPQTNNSTENNLRQYIPKPIRGALFWLKTPFVTPLPSSPGERESIFKLDSISDVETREYTPIREGIRTKVPSETVEWISANFDCVVQNGHGILTGEVLTKPEHGVLSYHHGDVREYRGVPPGFWEFIHGSDRAGVTLQQLTEELDAGRVVVIEEIDISGATSWNEIQQQLHKTSEPMLAEGIMKLQEGDEPSPPNKIGELYTRSDVTGWEIKVRYLLNEIKK